MAYPIEALQPNATEQEVQQALIATVEQMVGEGISEEEAMAKAQELLRAVAQQSMMPNSRTTTNYTSGEFARGGSLMGSGGGSNGYQTIPNPRLNNINPAIYPRGSI